MANGDRKKKIWTALGLIGGLLLMAALCFWAGKPMLELVSNPEGFRAWVREQGLWGKLAFVGMMALQIIIAFIPGEPLEIGAGYAFGAIEGTALCLLGALLGGTAVFLLVRRFGMKVVAVFFPEEKVRGLSFLQDEKRLNLIAYIFFLIPGTPKDVMTYMAGLTPMKLPFWVFLTLTARIPSVLTSTIGGDALGASNYTVALWVFAATALISGAGVLLYRRFTRRQG